MTRRFLPLLLCALLRCAQASSHDDPAAFDGTFRLATGEEITGGYFVENAQGRYLYMDPIGLRRGALFERIGERRLRSIAPPGVELEFVASPHGALDRIAWKSPGGQVVAGERIRRHDSREVAFRSADGTGLAGRLLLPRCPGPHPLVVSVHGSGPVDRFGGPYHLFFLARGIAVLAYDKRGYTRDRGAWREPDLAALAADAAAAIRFAAGRPEIDGRRIGVMGSSQAGWVAPRAVAEAKAATFLILRAGAALTVGETLLHEVRQELRARGLDGIDLDHAVALREQVHALALQGEPLSATDALVTPYLGKAWYRKAFGEGPIAARWSQRWWGWLQRNLGVTPVDDLRRLAVPVLWFLAERDENVPLVATRAALERAFADSPGGDERVVVLDGALHSFLVPAEGGPPRFAPGFFSGMDEWLERRGLTRDGCEPAP